MKRCTALVAIAIFAACAAPAVAQSPAGAAGRGQGPQGPPFVPMRLTSPAFTDSTTVPVKYTCLAQPAPGVSPPLQWSDVPRDTASLVLIVHDLERQRNNRGFPDFLHWILWNIPPAAASLPESVGSAAELPDGTRQLLFQGRGGGPPNGYRNLCTPPNDPPHHFVFELFALDRRLELPAAPTRAEVEGAIDGHLLGHAVLVGLFRRAP